MLVYASDVTTVYPTNSYTFNAGKLSFTSYSLYWNGHMTDSVKLSCNFSEINVLSPELDLYTCNIIQFSLVPYPPDILLD